jgi:hypothetical protein
MLAAAPSWSSTGRASCRMTSSRAACTRPPFELRAIPAQICAAAQAHVWVVVGRRVSLYDEAGSLLAQTETTAGHCLVLSDAHMPKFAVAPRAASRTMRSLSLSRSRSLSAPSLSLSLSLSLALPGPSPVMLSL